MTRIKKIINERIFSRSNLKFSKLTSLELYCRPKGELLMRFCGEKWLSYRISKFMWYSWMALFILGALNKIKTFKLTKYKKLNLLLAWQMCWIMLLWRPRRTVFYQAQCTFTQAASKKRLGSNLTGKLLLHFIVWYYRQHSKDTIDVFTCFTFMSTGWRIVFTFLRLQYSVRYT